MSVPPDPHPTSPEQREQERQDYIDQHYLEPGRRYTFETKKLWINWAWYGKRMRWHAYIRQAECPWMLCAVSPDFVFKFQAEGWAQDYLERGGPPEGYFDPAPPDPNEILYEG